MMTNLTNDEIAIASLFILFGLSLIVWLDRYLTRRRSAAMNAGHLARLQAQASNYTINPPRFQNDLWEVRASEWSEKAFSIAGASVHSFSRRRVVRDPLGRVMAVHQEEILTPDFNRSITVPQTQRALVLAPAA
jgi:hypothetical protein